MNGARLALGLAGAVAAAGVVARRGGSAARATPARVKALRDALREWTENEGREDIIPGVVYHGTNGAKWARTRGTRDLHLSVDPHEAWEYAYLSAMSQLDLGVPADPRIYRVNVHDLAGADLGPDRGSVDRYREDASLLTPRQKRWFLGTQAWRATAEETGFFVVRYPSRDLLDRFVEVPRTGKHMWQEPRFDWPSIPGKDAGTWRRGLVAPMLVATVLPRGPARP